MKHSSKKRGFSLIELMVSVAVFSVVMVIAVGTLLAMINANQKAQALKSVMNNLNFALESMVRHARIGTTYHCENSSIPPPDVATPSDCASGGVLFAFETFDGDRGDPTDQFVFRLMNNRLERSSDSGSTFNAVTAEEVHIDGLTFYVVGSASGDNLQPKMVVTIHGTAGVTPRTETKFELQAMATQRILDL